MTLKISECDVKQGIAFSLSEDFFFKQEKKKSKKDKEMIVSVKQCSVEL